MTSGKPKRESPLTLRLPPGERAWLTEHAHRTGRPVGAILRDALAAYRATHDEPREISR